jgi:hypothetical protein
VARQLGEASITQDDLTNSEKATAENYLLYVKKREIARMGDALDEGGIVNVAIAQKPVVPALPVWPPGPEDINLHFPAILPKLSSSKS